MSARQGDGLLTSGQRIAFSGLEGALGCAVEEMRALAQADQPSEGLTPAEWAELAEAAEQWRQSITDLLDLIAKHRAGGA